MTTITADGGGLSGPAGYTYCGIFAHLPRESVLTALGELRFSGWLGPQEGNWVVAVPTRARGAVAGDGKTAPDVARALAADVSGGGATLTVTVEDDKVLRLWAYDGDEEIAVYVSDPTIDAPDDDEIDPEPAGAEFAGAIARACGAPDVAEQLEEALSDELTESVIESERLTVVLRLLGLPTWIVAADSLPKDVPGGPRAGEVTRLGAGKEGVAGRVGGTVTSIVRKRS